MTKNKLDFSTMSNGGVNARYNTNRKDVEIEPMKTTGDIKEELKLPDPNGVAKASPAFKEVEKPKEEVDEAAKAKAIAENSKKVEEVKEVKAEEEDDEKQDK
jgi:hypothetical protein